MSVFKKETYILIRLVGKKKNKGTNRIQGACFFCDAVEKSIFPYDYST